MSEGLLREAFVEIGAEQFIDDGRDLSSRDIDDPFTETLPVSLSTEDKRIMRHRPIVHSARGTEESDLCSIVMAAGVGATGHADA